MLLIILSQLSLFYSTIISRGDYWSVLVNSGSIIGLCMLTELCVNNGDSFTLFKGLFWVTIILAAINLVTVFVFPEGLYTNLSGGYTMNWFLGYRNNHIGILLPCIIFAKIMSIWGTRNWILELLSLLISSVTIFITWSATSVVGFTIILGYLLLFQNKYWGFLFNSVTFSLITFLFFLSVIIFQIQNGILRTIVTNMLNRDLTFTGRVYVWDRAIELIKNNSIFGYGVLETETNMILLNAVNAHNQFLQVSFQQGIIGTILFLSILIYAVIVLYRQRNNPIAGVLSVSLFAFWIMFTQEAYNLLLYYVLIILSCKTPQIINQHSSFSKRKIRSAHHKKNLFSSPPPFSQPNSHAANQKFD